MAEVDPTIYKLLIWTVPIILSVLGFIGALMVSQLMKLSDSVNEIKVTMREIVTKHDGLEKRVNMIEEKVHV